MENECIFGMEIAFILAAKLVLRARNDAISAPTVAYLGLRALAIRKSVTASAFSGVALSDTEV